MDKKANFKDSLITYAENTWCPGCGNFAILNAFKNAVLELEKRGIGRERIVITAGIGCHGKIFDYLNLSGLYSLHGRAIATAEGIKLANPDLKVVAFVGDGDAFGEGLEHLIFAAKRNIDITVITHDNGVYALTTGQYSPLSPRGFRSPSSPKGTIEEPFNPVKLALQVGSTFVARGYSGRINLLRDIFVEAILHKGFSFVDVLQPCVTFNNTYPIYNKLVRELEREAESLEEALKLAEFKEEGIPIGVIYRTSSPTFHELLYGDHNPFKDKMSSSERLEKVKTLTFSLS